MERKLTEHARNLFLFGFLFFLTILLFGFDLCVGSSGLGLRDLLALLFGKSQDSASVRILIDIRLQKALVALFGGAALTVSGLQMQTLFRNPLAGPYVLGISSGASLGVALAVLGAPIMNFSGIVSSVGIAGAAWIGSASILVIIAVVSQKIKDIMVILILGMMFSSGVSAVVQTLQYLSPEGSLKQFVIWTMGSLGEVTKSDMTIFAPAIIIGLLIGILTLKPLNLLSLGEDYARTSGVDLKRTRNILFLSTTLLTGSVTAFCGPIGFIGLAMPHVARSIFSTYDQRILMPASVLVGSCSLLLCDILSKQYLIPINAMTSLLGIPVVIWVVIKNR